MKRLTIRVTDEQHDRLAKEGPEAMAVKVRRILGDHFSIDAEDAGTDVRDRTFKTSDGDMLLPSRILIQISALFRENRKIAAIKLVRAYCSETYGRGTKPIPRTTDFYSRFGLAACKDVCDELWQEWTEFPPVPWAGNVP